LTQQTRIKAFHSERQQHRDYFLSLIYAEAPELRNEPLVSMDANWGGPSPRGDDIRTADLEARFRFERDGYSTYRFVRVERVWVNPSKPPKVTVTTGRERATHVIEERPYRRTSE
jgi:hypothetical protein